MKKLYTYLSLCIFLLPISLISCKQGPKGVKSDTEANTEANTEQVASIPKETLISYPIMDQPTMTKITTGCTQVDYIFYNLPISISQNKPDAIRSNIMFIGTEGVSGIPSGCRPMGRKFFAGDGETIVEADMYLNPDLGCAFYIFHVDGKPTFANKMTQEGVNFYLNVFNQAGLKING